MAAQERIEAICGALPDVAWSISIRGGDRVVAEVDPDRVLRIASLGKLLVLMAAAERIEAEPGFADRMLPRPGVHVADSGLWQHLSPASISIADACILTASVSDNLATNALIAEVGLDACNDIARCSGHPTFVLHDIVRDVRTEHDPVCLAEGSARDARGLLELIDSDARWSRVRGWLALGVDHSMALGAIGADPLSPGAVGEPAHAHKTGSDPGVRADAGLIGPPGGALAYAAIANTAVESPSVAGVADAMRMILAAALAD